MQPKQIPIRSLNNMFLSNIPMQAAQLDKIIRSRNGRRFLARSGRCLAARRESVEERFGLVVEEIEDRLRQERCYDAQ